MKVFGKFKKKKKEQHKKTSTQGRRLETGGIINQADCFRELKCSVTRA